MPGDRNAATNTNRRQPTELARIAAALFFLTALISILALNTGDAAAEIPAQMQPTPGAGTGTPDSWVLIPSMPPDATQADYGEQYYILVCRACHGDIGRGLTPEWIGQWAPPDQNCWQSKCHSPNHPPDGFEIPKYVPPIMGEDALLRFTNAAQLYEYIRYTMPMQAPDTLLENEYWQVTAFLLRANQVPLPPVLDASTAAEVLLPASAPQQVTTEPTSLPVETPTPLAEPVEHPNTSGIELWLPAVILAVILAVAGVWAIRRRSNSSG